MTELDLKTDLDALVAEATKYPYRSESVLPDFALFAFATDVREHATAVDILAASGVPRASFANARAALESAVDAAFLVSDEKQYLYRGAQARVAELYEADEIERRAKPLDAPLPKDAPARMHPEDVIIADASAWDEQAPGKGDLLRHAWETFTKVSGAVRMHWSLLSRDQVFQEAFSGEEKAILGGMTQVIHALVSMASHPRMRAGSRDVVFDDDGVIRIGPRDSDADMARKIAALACRVTVEALRRRRTFA